MEYITKSRTGTDYELVQFSSFSELEKNFSKSEIINYVNDSLKKYQVLTALLKVAQKIDTQKLDVDIIKAAFGDVNVNDAVVNQRIKRAVKNDVDIETVCEIFEVDKKRVNAVVNE